MNYKIFFKYIFSYKNIFFLKNIFRNDKNTNLYINEKDFYFLILHIKLSSLFYSVQLIDIFAYDLIINNFFKNNKLILVYNFHLINFQQRFFFFLIFKNQKNNFYNFNYINSINELFLNSNWLEREVSELHGFFFWGKKDLRNLMLQYGDTSAPMQKIFPSIGTKDIYYDSINDLLIQTNVSIQF